MLTNTAIFNSPNLLIGRPARYGRQATKLIRTSPVTRLFSLLIAMTLMLGMGSAMVNAASLEEVIVVADFRDINEAVAPSSISIISADVIAARGAQHFEEVIARIPNFNFAGGTGRSRFFQIRGIGERSQFVDPINPSVGLLIDNVDFSGIGSVATLMDVKQIDVLRGPQGTRYGANALAGLINITTNDPEPDFGANIRATVGDYGHSTLGFTTTGPLTDNTSFRLAAEKHESDGFYSNRFLNRDDVNRRDETSLRGKLKMVSDADADTAWQTVLTLANTDVDNGYDAFTFDNTRVTQSDQPGFDRQESTSIASDTTWYGKTMDLQVIASVANTDSEYGFDEDWSFLGFHPDEYSSFDNYERQRDTASLEARLISNEPLLVAGLETDWIVGIYSLKTDEELQRTYTFDSDFRSDFDFTNLALFTQLDTALTSQWNWSTGLRIERRTANYSDSRDVQFDPDETLWGGRLALQYTPQAGQMYYVSLSRGYKAGGFNTDGSLDADLREFSSESLLELELGAKLNLMDDRLTLRGAVFYDQRRDQQVKSSLLRARPNGSTEFIEYLGNAAEGTNRGIELETQWLALDTLTLYANVGLLRARFDEFINEAGVDLAGRDQAQAPRYTYSYGGQWRLGNWQSDLSVDGKDDFFFSDRHELRSTSLALLNANISYVQPDWQLRLWGRNLTNKDYTIRGFGSFGNNPANGYTTEPYVQFGEPRMIGLSAEYTL
ncbi:MAG: outer membrane receptor protein involved in Fe transport [Candidatus Azotimanducaceae bacterium]|jgi:outer membrane receptor protein involved in Fe transport